MAAARTSYANNRDVGTSVYGVERLIQ